MRNQVSAYINNVITIILIIVVVLTPLVFASFTTEFFETPKLIFLATATLLLVVLWSLSWVLQGRVLITRSPLDIPLLLLLIIVVLSTIFSPVRETSIVGSLPRVHGSAISWVTYIIFFFVATSNLRSKVQIKTVYYALLASTVISSVIAILSYFGVYLPIPFVKFANFTPTGSSFSSGALALLMLPLPLLSLMGISKEKNTYIPLPFALFSGIILAVTVALFADPSIFIAGVILLLLIFMIMRAKNRPFSPLFLAPLVVAALVLVFSYLPIGKANPLRIKSQNFPREIQLPFLSSWKISASSFRDNPFLGSGPATYLFDFTSYKPIEFNASKYWNIRFDSASNEFLQILATLGGLGVLALIFFAIMVLAFAWKGLNHDDHALTIALSIAGILAVVILLLHSSSLVLIVALMTILSLLMATHKSVSNKVEELTIGIKASKLTDSNLVVGDILPLILLIPILFFVIYAVWNGSKLVLADYEHRQALNAASTKGLDTYNHLVRAEQLNPLADLYRTDLAQTNFALANAIAQSKGPTQSSPSGSLTDQDKQNIQQLLSQSIAEGRAATTINPLSAQNWEVLASIYRQISGVAQNALDFSLDAYGRAIQRDPYNPLLRLSVGGVYYSVKNYDLAIRFFSDSINLKPDFANAYYNLSIALRDKGDIQNAVAAAERVVALVDSKSADYKTAADYLKDLKARAATGSAQSQTNAPPAAAQNGALQQKDLPKVLDLPKPENISTPAAVRRPRSNPTSGQCFIRKLCLYQLLLKYQQHLV